MVKPGKAVIHYAVPMPSDSHEIKANSEEVPLDLSVKTAAAEFQ